MESHRRGCNRSNRTSSSSRDTGAPRRPSRLLCCTQCRARSSAQRSRVALAPHPLLVLGYRNVPFDQVHACAACQRARCAHLVRRPLLYPGAWPHRGRGHHALGFPRCGAHGQRRHRAARSARRRNGGPEGTLIAAGALQRGAAPQQRVPETECRRPPAAQPRRGRWGAGQRRPRRAGSGGRGKRCTLLGRGNSRVEREAANEVREVVAGGGRAAAQRGDHRGERASGARHFCPETRRNKLAQAPCAPSSGSAARATGRRRSAAPGRCAGCERVPCGGGPRCRGRLAG